MYYQAQEWIKITLLCEKLHVLPHPGGLFQQDEQDINRLSRVFEHLEQYRSDEIEQAAKTPNK